MKLHKTSLNMLHMSFIVYNNKRVCYRKYSCVNVTQDYSLNDTYEFIIIKEWVFENVHVNVTYEFRIIWMLHKTSLE
jgi:hypothetical protein